MLVVGEFLFLFVLHLSFLLKALIISVTLENKSISLLEEANFRAKSKVKPLCVCVCVEKYGRCECIKYVYKNRPQEKKIGLSQGGFS